MQREIILKTRKIMRKIKIISLLAGLVLLAACGGSSPPAIQPIDPILPPIQTYEDDPYDVGQEPTPAQGGHIHVAMPIPQTLNPLLNSDPDLAQVLRLIFEPLVVFVDQEIVPNPIFVRDITLSPAGNSLTITLRDNVFWEDGSPITSQDIAFSINTLRNNAPQTAVYRPNVARLLSHSIVNDRTIHISISPTEDILWYLDFPIISYDYYRQVPTSNLRATRNMHPIGNGAFRFHSYIMADRMELIANETSPHARPYIDRVTALVLRDFDDAIHAFEQGIIDAFAHYTTYQGRFRALGKEQGGLLLSPYVSFMGFRDAYLRDITPNLIDWDVLLSRHHPNARAIYTSNNEEGSLELLAGQSLRVIVNQDNLKGIAIAATLYEALEVVDAALALDVLPATQFQAALSSGDFDIVIGTANLGIPPAAAFSTQTIGSLHIIPIAFRDQFLYASSQIRGIAAPSNNIFANVRDWFVVSY